MPKKSLLFALCLLPFVWVIYNVFFSFITDPIKYFYTQTGTTALFLLLATTMAREVKLVKYRKMLGLFTCFYACLHLGNFIGLDARFDLAFAIKESVEKPFVYLGMIAFAILLFMAFTSSKKAFKKHNKKHKLIYLAVLLIMVHFTMAQKVVTIELWWYFVIFAVVVAMKMRRVWVESRG